MQRHWLIVESTIDWWNGIQLLITGRRVLSSSVSYFVVRCFYHNKFNNTKFLTHVSNWWYKGKQSDTNNYRVMQQFGTSVFHMVVHWHKLGEVVSECTLHNSVVLTIFVPKSIKVGGNLTKLWQKQFWLFFFWDTVYIISDRKQ